MLNTAREPRLPVGDPAGDPVGASPGDLTGGPVAAPLVGEAVEARGIRKSFGAQAVLDGVDLAVRPGALVALLGPSGCGKTTLLRIIAGLEAADEGSVTVGARVLSDAVPGQSRRAARGVFVPPEQRRIGMVFQDWALFPHLSVAKNVAYGIPSGDDRQHRIDEALALVGLSGLGDRMPSTLSGGQQQRVALARAIAPRPHVLLLDEPFSNLDTSLRVKVRGELHELLVDLAITTIVVTHDQQEAFILGDEVAVMNQGRIVQQASPAELYQRPVDPWVANFVGEANFVRGEASGGVARTPIGDIPLEAGHPAELAGPVDVLLRPEELAVAPAGADSNPPEAGLARVELLEFYGHDTVVIVRLDTGERLRIRHAGAPRVERGDEVVVHVTGARAMAYPAGASATTDDPTAG